MRIRGVCVCNLGPCVVFMRVGVVGVLILFDHSITWTRLSSWVIPRVEKLSDETCQKKQHPDPHIKAIMHGWMDIHGRKIITKTMRVSNGEWCKGPRKGARGS
jgi:hypothetical protein